VAVRGSFIYSLFHEIQGEFSQTVTADNEIEKRRYVRFITDKKVQATSKSNYHTSHVTRRYHWAWERSHSQGFVPTAKEGLFPHLRSLAHVNKIRRRHLIRGFVPAPAVSRMRLGCKFD
jgi:hypothetical protein